MIALDTNVLIYACDKADLRPPADLHLRHHVSFWDALILAACLDAGVSLLYSEDIPGGDIGNIPVVNPFK